jgi:hypothetical protein
VNEGSGSWQKTYEISESLITISILAGSTGALFSEMGDFRVAEMAQKYRWVTNYFISCEIINYSKQL